MKGRPVVVFCLQLVTLGGCLFRGPNLRPVPDVARKPAAWLLWGDCRDAAGTCTLSEAARRHQASRGHYRPPAHGGFALSGSLAGSTLGSPHTTDRWRALWAGRRCRRGWWLPRRCTSDRSPGCRRCSRARCIGPGISQSHCSVRPAALPRPEPRCTSLAAPLCSAAASRSHLVSRVHHAWPNPL